MLSKKEFDVLVLLYNNKKKPTQRDIANFTGFSLGSVNKTIASLQEKKFITERGILTNAGKKALSPHKVDNAIIMAAGMSSRFAPISYEKPKGLLKVKGEILIERQIRQLIEVGIKDITVVVGYMKEQFFYLQEKYGVTIITNEDYYRYNNTSTLMCVLDKLKNTYICSSDNYFNNNVFNEYEYSAYYSTVYSHGFTDEWCVKTDNKDRITNVVIGDSSSWYMLGHVYFDKTFSKEFTSLLKKDYLLESTKHMLWEDVYIKHIDKLSMCIKKFTEGEILEFDSLDDLRKFDKDYLENTNSKILQNICLALNCKESNITNISTIKNGPSAISFKFECNGFMYIYRHPELHSSEYINYKNELDAINIAKSMDLCHELVYMHPEEFWKIFRYTEVSRPMDYTDSLDVSKALTFIKRLHSSKKNGLNCFDLWTSTENMTNKLKNTGRLNFPEFDKFHNLMASLNNTMLSDSIEPVMCNNNFYDGNILINSFGDININDWKYAGLSDPYGELGTFICCSNYTFEEAMNILNEYHDGNMSELQKKHAVGQIALASYHWYIWAIYQDNLGTPIGNNTYKWFLMAKEYYEVAIKMYGVSN